MNSTKDLVHWSRILAMKKTIYSLLAFTCFISLQEAVAQEETTDTIVSTSSDEYYEEPVEEKIRTFESTRIVSGHSVETLGKGVLEYRIEHRFGDLAGADGGAQTWFGLDNSADIRMAFEYGITDKLMVGLGRSKGNGNPYRSLVDAFAKYRVLHQNKKMPISMAVLGTTSYSYMKASTDLSQVSSFPKTVHRFAYSAQLNIARNFGDVVSVAVMPTVVHRNYVKNTDQNTLFSVGGAARWSITKKVGLIAEYYQVFAQTGLRTGYTNSLGFAVEWITFGHNFTIYLTNSTGFGETQFITNTTEDWMKGQFRLGFCIGRKWERE